jgi:hypothetical protein
MLGYVRVGMGEVKFEIIIQSKQRKTMVGRISEAYPASWWMRKAYQSYSSQFLSSYNPNLRNHQPLKIAKRSGVCIPGSNV